jgi:hypothetical protein
MKSKHLSRLLLAGSTAALGLGIPAVLDTAHAAKSGSIVLTGTIAQNCSITVTPASAASTLTLTATQTNLNVGSVVEQCNDFKGYKITVASTNNPSQGSGNFTGILQGATSGNTDTISYTVAYGQTSNVVPASTSLAESVTTKQLTATTNSVFISYTGVTTLGADTYSDTLTLTMATN